VEHRGGRGGRTAGQLLVDLELGRSLQQGSAEVRTQCMWTVELCVYHGVLLLLNHTDNALGCTRVVLDSLLCRRVPALNQP
jgi:hypothetical protein